MIIFRHHSEPVREGLIWSEKWGDLERTLVSCWENGRRLAQSTVVEHESLCRQVCRGELPAMEWQGGFEEDFPKKMKKKYGSNQYLATTQGIKGESLEIDTDEDREVVCSRTKIKVIFTSEEKRLS